MIRRFFVSIISLLCLGTGAAGVAQSDNCLALIEAAVSSIVTACQDLQTGTACSPQTPEARQSITQLERIESSGPGDISIIQLDNTVMLLSGDASLDRLADDRSWHFTGEVDEHGCDQRHGTFALLVPEGTNLTMTLNGLDIALESAYVVVQYQSPNSLSLTIMRGELRLEDGTTVQAGKTIVAVTDNHGTVFFWSAPRPVNDHERQVADTEASVFNALLNTTIVYGAICETITHIVQRGENLFRISLNHNARLDDVMAFNQLTDSTIYPGQEISIPCEEQTVEVPAVTCGVNTTHTVTEGDNLFRIALNHHSSVDAIKAANRLTSNTIFVGDQLVIPCSSQPANTTATTSASPHLSIRSQRDVCYSIALAFPSGQFPGQLVNFVQATCS